MESEISAIFISVKNYMEKDQKLREEISSIVRNLEQSGREIITCLQIIHKIGNESEINSCCTTCYEIIEKDVKPEFEKLKRLFHSNPDSQYYKYHDLWRFISEKLSFAVALITYLESGALASHDDVAKILGIQSDRKEGFHLDLDDYLTGLLQLSSELSRLAVNSVTYEDYNRPLHISKFISELNAGFRLLNLKNDSLRKRFDALKYDVKKIEEVVYDLTIRGFVSQT